MGYIQRGPWKPYKKHPDFNGPKNKPLNFASGTKVIWPPIITFFGLHLGGGAFETIQGAFWLQWAQKQCCSFHHTIKLSNDPSSVGTEGAYQVGGCVTSPLLELEGDPMSIGGKKLLILQIVYSTTSSSCRGLVTFGYLRGLCGPQGGGLWPHIFLLTILFFLYF